MHAPSAPHAVSMESVILASGDAACHFGERRYCRRRHAVSRARGAAEENIDGDRRGTCRGRGRGVGHGQGHRRADRRRRREGRRPRPSRHRGRRRRRGDRRHVLRVRHHRLRGHRRRRSPRRSKRSAGSTSAVNVAGGGIGKKTLDKHGAAHDLESFRSVVDLNLVATFNLDRLEAEAMAKNEPNDEGERGVIINTASIAAFEGQIGQIAYTASKAGVAGMSLTMARDLGSFGIRVNAIAPSLFDTGIVQGVPDEFKDGAHQGRRLPVADGQARRVRQAGRGDHREPDAQRGHDPPRRRPALRAALNVGRLSGCATGSTGRCRRPWWPTAARSRRSLGVRVVALAPLIIRA